MKNEPHIIDREANDIIHEIIPKHWTIRDYRPDYGIDLVLEIFEKRDDNNFETLGEHIFIQLKGIKKVSFKKFKIKSRYNIEKEIKYGKERIEIKVLPYNLDTSELYTVQRMSNVLPVMLFVVDVSKKDIYFININDYIDKILIHEDPDYCEKKHKTIHIPINNKISLNNPDFNPLKFYAKRPKYYSLFNKISYQTNEISYLISSYFIVGENTVSLDEYNTIIIKIKHFVKILLTFDVWGNSCVWSILAYYEKKLIAILQDKIESMVSKDQQLIPGNEDEKRQNKLLYIKDLWQQMNNLYNVYEESCRESWLPTWLSQL